MHLEGWTAVQSHETKCRPEGTASMTPSVPLNDAGEAALPGVTGTGAPKELTASQRPTPTEPVHMNKSLEESAKATELPSNTPPKADCRPSKGSEGHAGVMGVEENVNREAMYLQKYEESSGQIRSVWEDHWSNTSSCCAAAGLQASSSAQKTKGKRLMIIE